ncbi:MULTISPECIES: helix-turn-helix domain-containing protein [unclassified Crossiella]|uniref:helix-turn-helix domain-containing protein n=1 Tax=unclassified Crossiella TaxID=2620835 RepID=UPI001FFF3DEB|nr:MULTISPECIES: helix-turn-helix domain-containing protein [unclassified Crossiella]MCK2242339.1 helix-turn-helix domain-containing protein [Crossiella sp. S99.2]MCK2254630.1 helix-turn-helix domain-containing protein [Crossiella sp. S99.1]
MDANQHHEHQVRDYTYAEAARLLRISKRTLLRRIKAGELVVNRGHGCPTISAGALEAYRKLRERNGARAATAAMKAARSAR